MGCGLATMKTYHVEIVPKSGERYFLNLDAVSCADAFERGRKHIGPEDSIVSSHVGEKQGSPDARKPFYGKL